MPHPQFDRSKVRMLPLAERQNKKEIERDHVRLDCPPPALPADAAAFVDQCAADCIAARAAGWLRPSTAPARRQTKSSR